MSNLLVSIPVKKDGVGDWLDGKNVLMFILKHYGERFDQIACLVYCSSEIEKEVCVVMKRLELFLPDRFIGCVFPFHEYNFFVSEGDPPYEMYEDVRASEERLEEISFTHVVEVYWRIIISWLHEADPVVMPAYLSHARKMLNLREIGAGAGVYNRYPDAKVAHAVKRYSGIETRY